MKLSELLIKPIVFYQKHISPRKSAPCCKYLPTCSQYAIDALREWGVVCGLALAFYRVLRCNPFSKGGYDPVPLKKKRTRSKEDSDGSLENNTDGNGSA